MLGSVLLFTLIHRDACCGGESATENDLNGVCVRLPKKRWWGGAIQPDCTSILDGDDGLMCKPKRYSVPAKVEIY